MNKQSDKAGGLRKASEQRKVNSQRKVNNLRKVVVVGSGPNGLVAAVTLAQAGCQVKVIEATERPGGGLRTEELTQPGFSHDVCSAVHPLAVASPALQALELEQYGLRWLHHEVIATHPLDGGIGAVLHQSLARTAQELGCDEGVYLRLLELANKHWPAIKPAVLGPVSTLLSGQIMKVTQASLQLVPRSALPAEFAAIQWFKSPQARALLAGCAAHAFLPLNMAGTAGFGILLLLLAHLHGWPVAQGGSQSIASALLDSLSDAGGNIELERPVRQLSDLPSDAVVFLDLTTANAAQLLAHGQSNQPSQKQRLWKQRSRKPSSVPSKVACWKIDYALSSPLPWEHSPSRKAGTVHLGGTLEELGHAQKTVNQGHLPSYPFTLVAQPTLIDPTRALANKHVAWVYAHVPYGYSSEAASEAIERQIERFAPGFQNHVLARSVLSTQALEAHNANYVGGDITGGRLSLSGLLQRSCPSGNPFNPYRLSKGVYLCSASTPPGPGTHGMAGYHAAQAALGLELRVSS